MKKLKIALLVAGLLSARGVLADTNIPWTKEGCESVKGTWITAHSATDSGCDAAHCNGNSFCYNPKQMNWWSALIWCQAIGHHLAELESACPNGLASSFTCANLNGRIPAESWVSTPNNYWDQYHIRNSIYTYNGNRSTSYAVLCAE